MKVHIDTAYMYRDLCYLNQFRSKASLHEVLTIMHEYIDYSKTASPALFHKVKHLDGLIMFPLTVTKMLAHGHVDQLYAHYGLDIYPHNANYTIGSFAKLFRNLESPPKSTFRELFLEDPSHPLYAVLLQGSEMCFDPLGPLPEVVVPTKPLPSILNVQMDNVVSDNKKSYVFTFWPLLVAKHVVRIVYINFILVGHTHDAINALYGRWSMA